MYDTIIIGAGMSGLAAGIRLAHYDQRVCILERHYTIGGLNSFYRLSGRDYDVGLHAITNFTPKGTRKGPFARLLRQLRFKWDDFALSPQVGSRIAFPDVELNFGNELDQLRAEIKRAFPAQSNNFETLLGRIVDYDDLDQELYEQSARSMVGETITDPLLVEMIFCPLMWYGNAREHDMDFGQFCIMFRSIFMEGLARPFAGVRLILKNLVRRFRELGGELKLRSGVKRLLVDQGAVRGVELDDGTSLEAKRVLSSAGWVETMRLCREADDPAHRAAGRMSFTEAIAILDCKPQKLGHDRTIVFYNDSDRFDWQRGEALNDFRTGVICSPNNFLYGGFAEDTKRDYLPDGVIRITSIANHDLWNDLSADQYKLAKLHAFDRAVESAVRFMPDFRSHIIETDMFTPTTIRRFTWHDNGAVYGAPRKQFDGKTHLENLFVCGTDQGFVGIIGAIISGISMANQHCLRD
jgi:phytoene dehydrogenase-like protein